MMDKGLMDLKQMQNFDLSLFFTGRPTSATENWDHQSTYIDGFSPSMVWNLYVLTFTVFFAF